MRVRPKMPLASLQATGALADVPPAQRSYLSREELATQCGANPHDSKQIT